MGILTMTRSETLKLDQISDFLLTAVQEKAHVVVSYTQQGKWRLFSTRIASFDHERIVLAEDHGAKNLKTNQPVGICIDIGHFKYLFEAMILGLKESFNGFQVHLELPDKAECMQRRVYERQPVPSNLKVKTLFWHRGYLNDTIEDPIEQYWQGRLLNLSASGAQIAVDLDMKDCFCVGQLVGVQFTPMSYERPLLLEAHVRYLIDQPDQHQFLVGIEFLGLESGNDGRQILHRLMQVTDEYEKLNQQSSANSVSI